MFGGIVTPFLQTMTRSWREAGSSVRGHTGDRLACQGCLTSKPCSVASRYHQTPDRGQGLEHAALAVPAKLSAAPSPPFLTSRDRVDVRPEPRAAGHSSWALPPGVGGWTQSWHRPKVLLIRTSPSRVGIIGTVHCTPGPVLGLTGKLKGLPIRLSSPVPSRG